MFAHFVKYFFIIIIALIIYKKLLMIEHSKKFLFWNVIFGITSPFIWIIVKHIFPRFTILTLLVSITFFTFFLYRKSFNLSILTASIAFGLSFISNCIITFIYTFIALLLDIDSSNSVQLTVIFLFIGITQYFVIYCLFSMKSFKYGMPFLLTRISGNSGTVICVILLIIIDFSYNYDAADNWFMFIISLAVICCILLLFWWKRQLKRNYISTLHTIERNNLRNELQILKEDNETLIALIHRDNKLIPAMELSVSEFLKSYNSSDALAVRKTADELLCSLKELSKDRNGIIATLDKKSFPLTNYNSIDTIINYMYARSEALNVKFTFELFTDIKPLLNGITNEVSLKTLLADLIENAIIASSETPAGVVLTSISVYDGHYCINIYDNGPHFLPDSLLNLGIIKYTGHKETGGSGIGLMTTYGILSKYYASFELDETIEGCFTKKVTICFDGLSQYRIKTNRDAVTALASKRKDMILL